MKQVINTVLKCALALGLLATAVGTASAQPGSFLDLGVIGGEGSYQFDTDNSVLTAPTPGDMDTYLGIWTAGGTLLGEDDDGSGGFPPGWSELTLNLTAGMYFAGITEFFGDYEDNFVNLGSGLEPGEVATVVLNIDDAFAGSVAGVTEMSEAESGFFKFTVVPEPTTLGLLSLLGIAGLFVRRGR